MRDLKKIVCTALAALTIVSSSTAVSTAVQGSVFTNSITVEAASRTPLEVINGIIDDYQSMKKAYEAKLAIVNAELKNAKDPRIIEDLKREQAHCKEVIRALKETIASLKAQIPKIYFKKYTGNSNSLVDALKALKINNTMKYRKRIAAANGISNYSGTAAQNTKMLNLLKKGKLQNPDATIMVSVSSVIDEELPQGLIVLS